MTSYIISVLLFNLLAINPAYAQNNNLLADSKILKSGVSVSKELPSGFYGSWSVSSMVIDSTNPLLIGSKAIDTWNISKNNNVIVLSNPESGATAAIYVEDVKGNTATFTRKKFRSNFKEVEQPRITLNGENFTGTDIIVKEKLKNGQRTSLLVIKYKISGIKLSGDKVETIFQK